ncbi:MAG: right-handed parallel beta-helix repeat-containing protein [Longimicrobiaceae bacterium]
MCSLRLRTGSDSTPSTRSPGITRRLRRRHALLALTLVSIGACSDAGDPVSPDPGRNPAYSASQAGSLAQTLSGCNGAAPLRTIQATPSNYRSLIAGLLPGDRLLLAAGTYTQGLPLHGKNGQPGKCIVVEGPASGSPALFTGSDSWNIVSLKDASYIAVRNLSLDGQNKAGDGVKAEATAVSVHHVLIEGLSFRNFNQSYLSVGISTKCPAWNWVVRDNTITSTGTGMYFGNSDGRAETANFLVEHNLVYNTLDYNVQFKHQLGRNTSIGMPSSGTTIIRHNTFSKAGSPPGGEQNGPNLLVGHWPLSGAGSSDIYQIYGNLFYENPYESLFQGEGNLAFHDNLLVNRTSEGVRIQPHNSVPRRIEIFNNTVVVGSGNGIRIAGADPAYPQRVVGNAVFAPTPLTGGQQSNNVTGTYAAASTYLNNPMAALGSGLNLYPKAGQLQGTAIDYSAFSGLLEWDRDFNGRARIATYRGAYSGDGVNPGWTPALAIKPEPSTGTQPPPSACSSISDVEPNNSMAAPQAISGACNQVSGTFLNDADAQVEQYDYFRLSLPAGQTVTALLDGLTVDYDLEIYDAAGNWVGSSYNGGTTPDQASWTNTSASATNVYVLVFRSASSTRTTYQLKVSYAASSPPAPTCNSISDVEPNNSMAAPQAISGACNQVSGTFLNDANAQVEQYDYFRLSLPAGKTVTALLNGLTVDYDLEIYDAAGNWVGSSYNGGTTPDQASWTNTTASATNVYVLVFRSASSTRTTYQLKVSY